MGVKLEREEYGLRVFENRVLREMRVGENGSSLFVLLTEYYGGDKTVGEGMQHACSR
jgi:hypothetical protein